MEHSNQTKQTNNAMRSLKKLYNICNYAIAFLVAGCALLLYLLSAQQLPCALHFQWRSSETIETAKSARIFCLITPTSYSTADEAVHSLHTWATHCQRVLFVGDKLHPELEALVLGHEHKWQALKEAFQYVYDYHFAEADWFLKIDEHNFVVVDNLRHLLRNESTEEPIYFGCKLKNTRNEPYMHGPSGYVLSKEALRRFVQEAMPNGSLCSQQQHSDKVDEEMGSCLRNVGVIAGDSRAADGSHTFMSFSPQDYFMGLTLEQRNWLAGNFYYNETDTPRLSAAVISFASVPWDLKYTLNYMVYNLRLYGVDVKDRATTRIKIVADTNQTAIK